MTATTVSELRRTHPDLKRRAEAYARILFNAHLTDNRETGDFDALPKISRDHWIERARKVVK